jgi:lactoylglutathione lyase
MRPQALRHGPERIGMAQPQIDLRAFPIVYTSDVERAAQFWELLGFQRHVQLPPDGEPGYVGLRRDAPGAELAVSNAQWATDRYGLSMGDGPRFEMYIYVADLDGMLSQLTDADVPILRRPEDMPWGERIATVADTEGNPVALCQNT